MNVDYDLVIVGAGPSALTAALYAGREGIKTAIVEKALVGGLMATVDRIENYPGFPNNITGLDLSAAFAAQAEKFNTTIKFGEVEAIEPMNGIINVHVDTGDIKAKSCLIASGATYRKLNIPGERKYYAKGVHYCATCDGAFYKGKSIVVIGGANSAIQETLYLAKLVKHVDLLVRSYIKASDLLQKQLQTYLDSGQVTLHQGWAPNEILGDGNIVNGVEVFASDNQDNLKRIDCDGVFIFAGTTPNTDFLQNSHVELDNGNCIVVDTNLATNVPGVFASGDVRSGATKQIVSAAGDGATAIMSIRNYLQSQNG